MENNNLPTLAKIKVNDSVIASKLSSFGGSGTYSPNNQLSEQGSYVKEYLKSLIREVLSEGDYGK